jgi:hypothetical protein
MQFARQEFGQDYGGVESNELDMAGMEEEKLERAGQKRKDNDDLDLALDALRDCDTDFSKFVQVHNCSAVRCSAY